MDIHPKNQQFYLLDEFLVDIEIMDDFRRKYIDLLNSLNDVIYHQNCKESVPEIFQKLAFYTENYFVEEELLLKNNGYPSLTVHRESHRQFIAEIVKFHEKFSQSTEGHCLDFLRLLENWFRTHLLNQDIEAVKFLKEKGVS